MIFVSYRKEDAGDLAWSLADKLEDHFGRQAVFLDRHQIAAGDNWREVIDAALSRAKVVLAVMGPRWLASYDEFGQRRIDRDDDVLAYELSAALRRGVVVIPLYLHGLKPLPAKAFPSRLAALADQQGIEFDMVRDLPALVERLAGTPGLELRERAADPAQDGARRPGCESKPWCVPDSIGALFKGRTETARELRERFLHEPATPGDNTVRRQVIFGLGGIGKTRMAIEYAWAYEAEYQAVLFVVADTGDQLRRSISDLAAPAILNLPEWKNSDEEIRSAAVIRWLSENPGWLLIIDNADDAPSVEAVEDLLPQLRSGHVIITSRYTRWSKSVPRTELDVLPLAAARAFLLDRTQEERSKTPQDEEVAEKLASELGCLALALEQAGAYIQHRDGGLSLAEYLSRWREGKSQVRAWVDKRLMHYDRSVAATWETTMQALDPAALTLFRILAWFAPDPIPRQMVSAPGVNAIIGNACRASGLTADEIDPEESLGELIAYSMTRKSDEQGVACVGLHRVVLEITRARLPQDASVATVVAAAELLVAFAPRESYRPEAWMEWRLLVSHAEAIWGVLHGLPEEHWNIELMKMLALYYMGQERHQDGIPTQREVLRLAESRLPPDSPEIFLARNDLALMVSDREEKERLLREALEGRIRVHGLVSVEAAETQFNLGTSISRRKPEEAEELLRAAMATHGTVNGPYSWRTLMAEQSLASLMIETGRVEAGEELLRQNLLKKRQHLGTDHPDTLYSLSLLADARLDRDDYAEYEALQRELVGGYRARFGPEDDRTLSAMTALADALSVKGDSKGAHELLAQTVPLWKRTLAELRAREERLVPETDKMKQHAISLNNCALRLRQCGVLEPAEEALRHALELEERERPADHPKIPHRLMNLATVLILQRRLDEASDVLARAGRILAEKPDVTSTRVLFLQYAVALLRSESGSEYLGQMKALLTGPALDRFLEIASRWEIGYLLVSMRASVPANAVAVLEALIKVMNAAAPVESLEELPEWRSAGPPAAASTKPPGAEAPR